MDILKFAAEHPSIKTVLMESKTEYLSTRKLDACLKAIGPKKLRIAIGLECKDDHLRNNVINKGMSKQAYERAIKHLHSLGIEVQSYVFMKPLTITEAHAIREAIESVEYAIEAGSDIVMLEAAMVQKGTPFETAFLKKEFDSPWLWSIREVANKTRHYKQLNVGIFDEEPKPLSYPKNCPECTGRFNQAFRRFRETHDFTDLAKLDCKCRSDWEKVIAQG
jgi:radical SAM enzyme (TIGR01210 family)